MGTATRPDCTDLHVVTAPPEKVLDLQSRDPRSCTSSVSGNKRCPITPPPTLLPVGVVMCDRPGSHFRTSPLLYTDEKG